MATIVSDGNNAINQAKSQLKVNETLENGRSLVSQNGRFSFINQDDGNIVLYDKPKNRPIWSSNTSRREPGNLTMQADGNLVGKVWSTKTDGKGNDSSVLMVQDDGDAVILSDGIKIWHTGTRQIPRTKEDEKKPLRAGEFLKPGEALVSPNGKFRFVLQGDGELCLFETSAGNGLLWTTEKRGMEPKLILRLDGNLDLTFSSWTGFESKTAGKGDGLSTLTVQDDGDVVLRSGNAVIWSTGTRIEAPANPDRLLAGEKLRPGQSLQSPNATYKLFMRAEGVLVLYDIKNDNKKLWSTDKIQSSSRGIFTAILQSDGNFVVYDRGTPHWSTFTGFKGDSTSILILQDDGDIVLRSKGAQIWASKTKQKTENLDCLVVDEKLLCGQYIKSPNGRYKFILQDDGNIVLHSTKDGIKREIYATGSRAYGTMELSLHRDGNLVLHNDPLVRWSTETSGKGDESSILRIQDDGDVVLTSKKNRIWSTETAQRDKTNYLNPGESLWADEALTSANKQFKLIMQADGNLVVYDVSAKPRSIWSAQVNGGSPVRATLERGGNFVVYSDGRCKWTSITQNCGSNLLVTMQDDGNVVLTSEGVYVWSTKTGKRQPVTGDRLSVGQSLGRDEALVSANGRYKSIFQNDGNFVLYENGKAVWSTRTSSWTTSVVVRDDDNLVLTGDDWSSGTRRRLGGGTAMLIMQDNGKLVLKSDGYVIWSNDLSLVNALRPKYNAVSSGISQLKRGEFLAVNQFLTSPNGQWSARLQYDGNFVLRHNSYDYPLWTSNTAPNSAVTKIVMQYDCNCVMAGFNESVVWATGTNSVNGDATLKLQDDGNLLLDGNVKWSTDIPFPAFRGVIKELKRGQSLLQNQSLTSENGQYQLTFTEDGTICVAKGRQPTFYYTCLGRSDARCMTFDGKDYHGLTVRIDNGQGETLWSAATRESKLSSEIRYLNESKPGTFAWERKQAWKRPDIDPARFTLGDDGNAYIWFENEIVFSLFEQPKNAKGSSPDSPSCLKAGRDLSPGQKISSVDDQYYCMFQSDLNLVIYRRIDGDSTTAIWSSGTSVSGYSGGGRAFLNSDGLIYIQDATGKIKWTNSETGTPGRNKYAVMEGDGSLCIYNDGNKIWSSKNSR